jgi:hypothetical protein
MTKAPAWRPFHKVFMERVINAPEVQRHRSDVDDEGARQFFDSGRRPGLYGDYRWRVDVPPAASPRWEGRPAPPPLSANVQAGWDAAMPYYRSFTADLFSGVLIAEASHWMSGVRREFTPAEWEQPRLAVDVFRGDLFVRLTASATWKAMALHTTEDQPVRPDKKRRGGRPPDYLWPEWKQALDAWLRDHRRPMEIERLVDWSKDWFKDNDAGVPSDRSIRRHLKPYYPRD